MDINISHFVEVEEMRRGSNISLLVPVGLDLAIVAGDQHEGADIKLSIVVEKGIGDVELEDESLGPPPVAAPVAFHYSLFYVIDFLRTCDPVASIRKLPRLHDPAVRKPFLLPIRKVLLELLELVVRHPRCDVESQRQNIPNVAPSQLIVLAHAVEQSLFVPQQPVGRNVVVHLICFRY